MYIVLFITKSYILAISVNALLVLSAFYNGLNTELTSTAYATFSTRLSIALFIYCGRVSIIATASTFSIQRIGVLPIS